LLALIIRVRVWYSRMFCSSSKGWSSMRLSIWWILSISVCGSSKSVRWEGLGGYRIVFYLWVTRIGFRTWSTSFRSWSCCWFLDYVRREFFGLPSIIWTFLGVVLMNVDEGLNLFVFVVPFNGVLNSFFDFDYYYY
jgi:hypothetical protein